MMLPLLASLGIAAAVGLALCRGVAFRRAASLPELTLLAGLAVALGLGIASSAYFVSLLVLGPTPRGLLLADLAVLPAVAVAALWFGRGAARAAPASPPAAPAPSSRAPRLLAWGFALAAACAVAGFLATAYRSPHGEWDAWMTWNLHARFIFRGGEGWRVMFSETSPLRHPDYPFLVPALVARGWAYAGSELLAAPVLVGFLFTFATVAVLCAALAVLRSPGQGLLAGLVLVGTPFFITHGASQYADVPVGLYLLAALALLCLHDRYGGATRGFLFLAGLAAGLAAWTKNEGLLFLAALVVARSLAVVPLRGWRAHGSELLAFAAGAAPVLLLVIYFKLQIAPANDLVSSSSQGVQSLYERLTDAGRYGFVGKRFARKTVSFGGYGMAGVGWLPLLYLALAGPRRGSGKEVGIRTGVLALAFILAGHVAVYLTAPNDLERLLDASLDRLLLQLWPGVLFLCFLIARTPEEARLGIATSPARARSAAQAREDVTSATS